MTKTIACDVHDYVEIACMYRYDVRLHLRDGQTIEGRARDIDTRQGKEFLVLDTPHASGQVDLAEIKVLQVLTPGARFQRVDIG